VGDGLALGVGVGVGVPGDFVGVGVELGGVGLTVGLACGESEESGDGTAGELAAAVGDGCLLGTAAAEVACVPGVVVACAVSPFAVCAVSAVRVSLV
jgi:hypothetical protein